MLLEPLLFQNHAAKLLIENNALEAARSSVKQTLIGTVLQYSMCIRSDLTP
jgi:hypothetical protein